jgi:hypothetical protein
MDAFNSSLHSVDVQSPVAQVGLRPAKRAEFLRAQTMTVSEQDRSSVA